MVSLSSRPRQSLCRRIAIHDYCGHPFQFQLSRELARRGHEVRHFYFAEDMGPKGNTERSPDDPEGFSIEPLSLQETYSKSNLIRRRQADVRYGRLAGAQIAAFDPDVTISGNTPLEAQTSILESAHRTGSAFIFWMQDFYSLAAAKILARKIPVLGHGIGAYYKTLEARMLRQSDGVVLISEDFRPAIQALGVDQRALEVIQNWGALAELPTRPKDTPWAREHSLSDKFVFLYTGTLAFKHNPDLLWALAEHFEGDPEVVIAVAGAGVSYEALKARCAAEQKRNLVLLPLQPMSVFPDVLGAADILVALLEKDAGPFSVPSKVLNYLCAGRPILSSTPPDNLSARIIDGAGAGTCVAAGDRQAFVAAAMRLRQEAQTRAQLGAAGRSFAEQTFDIVAIADRFEEALARAVARNRDGSHARTASDSRPWLERISS